MSETQEITPGQVVAIWRYPVKSMRGEELMDAEVTGRGLLGDRAYALVDAETSKVASAKDPRRWPNLFAFRASFDGPVGDGHTPAPASITLPDGEALSTDREDIEPRLSAAVGRTVTLARSAFVGGTSDEYRPDHDWLDHRDEILPFSLAEGTFFDCAMVHLVTTATLERLQAGAPGSRFDVRRFRPNLVIDLAEGATGFAEDGWIGHRVRIGDVVLQVDGPCPRCVMTTLSQGDLPKDPNVLRAVVRENRGNVGVYASVVRPGRVRRGDRVGSPE